MNDRPSAGELLEAVERFLEESVVTALDGPARFHARVAANVLRIVARELETEDEHLAREWYGLSVLLGGVGESPPSDRDALREAILARNEELVRRIRAGDADSGRWRAAVLQQLSRVVADKLDVAQPRKPRKEGEGA
jgi:hypothetical protein